jgi:hypothetical protein
VVYDTGYQCSLRSWKTSPKYAREHGVVEHFRSIGDQQQENLIDPLEGTTCNSKDVNLGGEGNNHSSQPPKLHPMDINKMTFIVRIMRKKCIFSNLEEEDQLPLVMQPQVFFTSSDDVYKE